MSEKIDVLKAMRTAEAYCYDAGAANAARNMKSARDAVVTLILAAERVARRSKDIAHRHAPGSIAETECDALIAALDGVAANA